MLLHLTWELNQALDILQRKTSVGPKRSQVALTQSNPKHKRYRFWWLCSSPFDSRDLSLRKKAKSTDFDDGRSNRFFLSATKLQSATSPSKRVKAKTLRFLWSVCLIVSPTITSCLFIVSSSHHEAAYPLSQGTRSLRTSRPPVFSQNNTFVTQMSLALFLCTGIWLTPNTLKIEAVSQPYSFNWGVANIQNYTCDFHKTTSSNQASQAVGPYSLVLQTHHRSHHSSCLDARPHLFQ